VIQVIISLLHQIFPDDVATTVDTPVDTTVDTIAATTVATTVAIRVVRVHGMAN